MKSGNLVLLAPFFFKIALASQGLLCFHTYWQFYIQLCEKTHWLFDKDCFNLIKVWKQCISASLENSVDFFVVETFCLNWFGLLDAVCNSCSFGPWPLVTPSFPTRLSPTNPSNRIQESHGKVTRPLLSPECLLCAASMLSAVRELSHFSFQQSFEQGGSVSSSRWGNWGQTSAKTGIFLIKMFLEGTHTVQCHRPHHPRYGYCIHIKII